MRRIAILCLSVALLGCGDDDGGEPAAACVPGVLLGGTVLPAVEGWTVTTNLSGAPDVTSNGTEVRVDSDVDAASDPVILVWIDTGVSDGTPFTLQWDLAVNTANDHNSFDAGVAFLAAYDEASFFGTLDQRAAMIYFDTDEIGWADESQSFSIDTTTRRTYRLAIDADGDAILSVDGVARLTRSDIPVTGTIAFGDQTNDTGVDGDFVISDLELICP